MLSFTQYRKGELERSVRNLTVREGIVRCFEVLRLELLETIKLPELLFEHNVSASFSYEIARKEDYADNKEIIEFVISQYKLNFYEELLSEASANPFLDLKQELTIEVKRLVQTLRDSITGLLSATRPTSTSPDPDQNGMGTSAPTSGSSTTTPVPAPAPTGSSSSSSSGGSGSTGGFGGGGHSAPSHSGGFGGGGHSAPSHSHSGGFGGGSHSAPSHSHSGGGHSAPSGVGSATSPSGSGGFTPAPYGHMRPSDGYFNGFKRAIYDPIAGWVKNKWRNFRRRWHNDPMREHTVFLENLFLENHDEVMRVIDEFEKNLLKYINDRIDQISASAGTPTGGSSPTGPAPAAPAAPTVSPNGTATAPVMPRGGNANAQQPAQDPIAAKAVDPTGTAPPETEQPLDQVAPEQKPQEEVRRVAGAIKGAGMLGLKMNNLGPRGGFGPDFGPNSIVSQDDKPIAPTKLVKGVAQEAGWGRVRDSLYGIVYSKIEEQDPQVIENYKNEKRTGKTNADGTTVPGKKAKIGLGDRKNIVNAWLGIKPVGSKSAIIDMLHSFYKKMSKVEGGQTTPPAQDAGAAPATQPVAANPEMEPAPTQQPNAPTEQPTVPNATAAQSTAPADQKWQAPEELAAPQPTKTGTAPVNPRGESKKAFFPSNPEALAEKMARDNPAEWKKLTANLRGDIVAGIKNAIEVEKHSPEDVYNHLLSMASKFPDKDEQPEIQDKALPTGPAPAAPVQEPQASPEPQSAVEEPAKATKATSQQAPENQEVLSYMKQEADRLRNLPDDDPEKALLPYWSAEGLSPEEVNNIINGGSVKDGKVQWDELLTKIADAVDAKNPPSPEEIANAVDAKNPPSPEEIANARSPEEAPAAEPPQASTPEPIASPASPATSTAVPTADAARTLRRIPGYNKDLERYQNAIEEVEGEDEALNKAEALENHLIDMIAKGSSPDEAMNHLKSMIQQAIQAADDNELHSGGNTLRHGDDEGSGSRSGGLGMSDEDHMRPEGFSHIVNRFKKMIHG